MQQEVGQMTQEQKQRLQSVDKSGVYHAEDLDLLPGLHFCPDWDNLPVCDASPEKSGCTCDIGKQNDVR